MPSRLRRAIGAVKDQTSIGLAKVTATATVTVTLDVPILRATSHDESPMDALHVAEILRAVASDRSGAAACAEAIARRLGRSRSWVVALKSLSLLLGVLHCGDPNFPREVRRVMKVVGFSGGSSSVPYDCAAFVRAFALYIDEKLHCMISHRLDDIRSLNPQALINSVSHCQKLLDRAIAARPSGDAAASRLVLTSLRGVVRESFGLYRDVSDGLALLLDGFFRLPYQSCVAAFQACVRASRQFEELAEFYLFCKAAGVGRTSEYPSVQRISAELLETLHEFLKDHASFSSDHGRRSDGGSAAAVSEEWEFSEAETSKGSVVMTLEGLLERSPPRAAPTFCVGDSIEKAMYGGGGGSDDPFETAFDGREKRDETVVSCEQRLWLENQKKIIAKRMDSNEFSL